MKQWNATVTAVRISSAMAPYCNYLSAAGAYCHIASKRWPDHLTAAYIVFDLAQNPLVYSRSVGNLVGELVSDLVVHAWSSLRRDGSMMRTCSRPPRNLPERTSHLHRKTPVWPDLLHLTWGNLKAQSSLGNWACPTVWFSTATSCDIFSLGWKFLKAGSGFSHR